MGVRRHLAAIGFAFALIGTAPAAAQTSAASLIGPIAPGRTEPTYTTRPMTFQVPPGDLRRPGAPSRNGLIAAVPLDHNVEIGVGRFLVPQIARPRTHMEADRQPSSVRPRDRGIAAVGISLRF
jgi:hypothetical protein